MSLAERLIPRFVVGHGRDPGLRWRMFAVALLLAGLVAPTGVAFGMPPLPRPAEDMPVDGEAGPSADSNAAAIAEGERAAEEALNTPDEETASEESEGDDIAATGKPGDVSLFELLLAGGHTMWPILAMSLLVVMFGAERWLGLRRRKVMPPGLIEGLGEMSSKPTGFNPRGAYRLCQEYPSAASNVIKAMLLKIGRPHAEVERAVAEANDREAARLYANVRWLNLAAGVSPLLGLLGTVGGMIQAFMGTANLPAGANKATELAEGIYMALVTTFCGLAVAIPAAVLAHFFEGKIQSLFRELDEALMGLMPQLERFEGRLRVSKGAKPSSASHPTPETATEAAAEGNGDGRSQQTATAK